MSLTLVVGNKNYSSWSLRAYLALAHTGAPFEEVVVPLDQPGTAEAIRHWSPSGRVPALRDGETLVWDSLAVCEYLAERFPEAKLWPADAATRALARSIVAEMHSGFAALRENMTMNIRRSLPGVGRTPEVERDIARITALWRGVREKHGASGAFLFDHFTIADAFYAPVVTRFTTYAVEVDAVSAAYMQAVWALPAMQKWAEAARAEPFSIGKYEPKEAG